ncbi:endonuclease MutS2 [Pseudobdellovibrio exovorus]|uniref:Endonuclease MutS2 n=1 Tax=Pseudobdellovibrio exovorus JSS TaxID=1184267 RepID=M4VCU6_9BACT|nr:Smr/MutS family protein [Pseudobdellovibrio exovorus]AGH95861.1 DNA mismatch repair protein [Pseudobdellovibrio exovorus JSS]
MFEVKNLDWTEILEKIKSFATSEIAREVINGTRHLASAVEAEKSFNEITSAQFVIQSGVRPHMESLDLFELWISRVKKKAVLKTLELKDIRHFCLESIALTEALKLQDTDWAHEQLNSLMQAEEPLSAIDNLMTASGDIRMDASERLFRLSKEKENLARQIQTHMDKLVRDHKVEHMLQEKYVTTREGRWVIPVKGGMQHFVSGVIHGSSQTKQTVYMEPETVIPMNNRLRQVEVEIEDEIERLLTEISDYMSTLALDFERTRQTLYTCDVLFAKAQLSALLEANSCTFDNSKMELKELSHPLLKLSGKPVVTNTVLLNEQKYILILSGPNAGGKTVLLKSIGLAAQMARCGLPICAAEGSTLPFFQEVVTGIGDSQSVDEDLSTFAAHLKILDRASHLKGLHNLILIDEICGSTDPEEGSALARAFIEKYAANQVFGIITSHLSPLKMGWKESDPILNGSLEYDTTVGKPTYQFLSGIPGESLAIQTAKRVGVSTEIVQSAVEKLTPEARARQSKMNELESLKKDIVLLQENLKQQLKKSQKLQQEYEQKIQLFEKEKDNKLAQTLKKVTSTVEEAIATAKAGSAIDKHRQLQEIKYNLPEIVKAKPVQSSGPQIKSAEEFGKNFPAGTKVFVPSLNQDGIIQSTPNARGEVLVLSQSVRLQVLWSELKPAAKAANPTHNLVRKSGQVQVSFADTDRTLDLRGKTVDEAISQLEIALDRATELNEDRLKIIHGHGTETLKKSVRTYLSRSVYVKKWKAGTSETGGDGVTWVELGQL